MSAGIAVVIAEENLKSEGLLERNYGWFVQWIGPSLDALAGTKFNGTWADWKSKVAFRRRSYTLGAKSAVPSRRMTPLRSGLCSTCSVEFG